MKNYWLVNKYVIVNSPKTAKDSLLTATLWDLFFPIHVLFKMAVVDGNSQQIWQHCAQLIGCHTATAASFESAISGFQWLDVAAKPVISCTLQWAAAPKVLDSASCCNSKFEPSPLTSNTSLAVTCS